VRPVDVEVLVRQIVSVHRGILAAMALADLIIVSKELATVLATTVPQSAAEINALPGTSAQMVIPVATALASTTPA